jgi:hypothetical protein
MGAQKEAIKLAIKDEFLGRFRKADAKAGDTLSVTWLYDEFLPSLGAKELQALEEVVNEMISQGLIEYLAGPKGTYVLTQKGEDILC